MGMSFLRLVEGKGVGWLNRCVGRGMWGVNSGCILWLVVV
jgi:hypothetical protein